MSDAKPNPLATTDPFLNAGDFQEDLGMFEAATHAAPFAIADIALQTLVVAPDGFNQDATVRGVAQRLAQAVGAQVVEAPGLKTADEVQTAKQRHGADLLVLPVPFGADIGDLREASLGDVVDRLLADALPLLAIRQLMDEPAIGECLRNVVIPLSPENPRSADALAWACRILPASGQLTVVQIADAELRAEASHLREPTEPIGLTASARVSRVLTRHFASPMAAIQRRARDQKFHLQIVEAGNQFVASTLAPLHEAPGLVIVAGSADRRSDSYHHEADLILDSRYPVLIV